MKKMHCKLEGFDDDGGMTRSFCIENVCQFRRMIVFCTTAYSLNQNSVLLYKKMLL